MYEKHFNLSEHPFRTTPDPRYLWYSSQHLEAKDKILYYLKQKSAFMALFADIGTGKTTLARRIVQELSTDKTKKVVYVFSPKLNTSNAFLRFVMDEYGIPTERAYGDNLRKLETFLADQHKKGISCALLVDEAQNMNRDMLLLIQHFFNFSTSTELMLQVVMFSQPEMKRKVKRLPSLKSRITPVRLPPFSREQLEEMLRFRWQVAGGKTFPFSPSALDEMFKITNGNPRFLVKLANEALLITALSKQNKVSKASVNNAVSEVETE